MGGGDGRTRLAFTSGWATPEQVEFLTQAFEAEGFGEPTKAPEEVGRWLTHEEIEWREHGGPRISLPCEYNVFTGETFEEGLAPVTVKVVSLDDLQRMAAHLRQEIVFVPGEPFPYLEVYNDRRED